MSIGFYRGNKNALLANAMLVAGVAPTLPAKVPPGGIGTWVKPLEQMPGERLSVIDIGPAKMSRSTAEAMGYTGDACDYCGSMKMQRTGHCNTCAECGTTTGCS